MVFDFDFDDIYEYESRVDEFGNYLLTNFHNEVLEAYQLAIDRYDKSNYNGLYIKLNYAKDMDGNSLKGHYHSLWCKNDCGDLSVFWDLHKSICDDIKLKILRRKKLERII